MRISLSVSRPLMMLSLAAIVIGCAEPTPLVDMESESGPEVGTMAADSATEAMAEAGHRQGQPASSEAAMDAEVTLPAGPNAGTADTPVPQLGSADSRPTIIDQTRAIPPRLEWTREIGLKRSGTITFRITSPQPYSVTVISGRAMQAMQRRESSGVTRADLVMTKDYPAGTSEETLSMDPGAWWFVIGNQSEDTVQIRLECFDG
jgi:hypothetical protein